VHQIKPENLVDVSLTNINNRSVSDSISKKMITNDDIDKIEQKVEHYNEDGSNNSGRKSTTRLGDVANRLKNICSAGIDAVSDGLGRATISNDNDDDDALFKDPPPKEDCPICMLPMPYVQDLGGVRTIYQPCCGKTLCWGCYFAEHEEVVKGNLKPWCSLCRVPSAYSEDEEVKRYKRRMDVNDAEAFYELGCLYYSGLEGLPKDLNKAVKLWKQAADLGSINAHCELADSYCAGNKGLEEDMEKADHHWKIAAIGGHEEARYMLGVRAGEIFNDDDAIKHYMISAKSGYDEALKLVGIWYKHGLATKDQYASTLRAYQDTVNEMKK